jgi:UPF0755 protein
MRLANSDVVPGKYPLRKGMSVAEIVDVVTGKAKADAGTKKASTKKSDKKTEAKVLTLTVPEGWRAEQIAEELVKIGWQGSVQDFMDAQKNFTRDNYDFLASRDNKVKPDSLEGFLFPDTYQINSDEPAQDIIQKMLDNFDAKFTPQMRDRAKEMNLSIYQVLTFASLIEREAAVSEERPVIADVFLNRYEAGINMESDPTVRYVLGKTKDGNWWAAPTAKELEDTDSPYNTYKHLLPPGPICNPSLDSIQAVLTPGGTNYLYFVALTDGSGRHLFAADKASQDQNVAYVNGQADAPAPGSDPFNSGSAPVAETSGNGDGEEIPIQSTDNGG